jgi:hypothetical protein
VAGVAEFAGQPAVADVAVGDRLLRVDDFAVTGATMGCVVDALRGCPGATRTLELEREGRRFTVKDAGALDVRSVALLGSPASLKFAKAGTRVLPVSVDAVPSLKAFKEKERMSVDLLSDFFRKTVQDYGVLVAEKGTAKRSYFLVDKQGVLRWSHVEAENGHRREDGELLEQIAKL